jgi:excinuclease ABC subunit C
MEEIEDARYILKGNISVVYSHFTEYMKTAAVNLEFERAQLYKDKIDTLERFQTKSLVVNKDLTDIDVFTITSEEEYAYVNYLQIKEGSIIFSKTIELRKKLDEPDDELLSFTAFEFREQVKSNNKTLLSNIPITLLEDGIENVIPKIGDKKKLIDLSIKNALELRKEKVILREGKRSKYKETLLILQKDMKLPTMPMASIPLRKGDVFRHVSAGGGGFGPAFAREPEMVLDDVREEKVSREAAEQRYGVVIDASLKVDESATRARRAAMQEAAE